MLRHLAGAACAVAMAGGAGAQEGGFYGIEKFTVVYELQGAENGSITEHVRDWGGLRAEIKDTTFSLGDFTETTRQRVVTEGDLVVIHDEVTNETWRSEGASPTAAAGEGGGDASGQAFLAAMGGEATGGTASYAGLECAEWSVPGLNSDVCITAEGVTLFTRTAIGGLVAERTAVEVRLGDGGPDSAFEYDAAAITPAR